MKTVQGVQTNKSNPFMCPDVCDFWRAFLMDGCCGESLSQQVGFNHMTMNAVGSHLYPILDTEQYVHATERCSKLHVMSRA